MLRSLVYTTLLAAGLATAHIEMMYPPPINSKYDPQTLEANKDYTMTAPLFPDGSNFPCKGYNTPEAYASLKPVATLSAGGSIDVQFAPNGATHMGGSCQFSISYDQGKTFAVIHSIIGACPLSSSYSVPVPAGLPSADSATFAWTWFNEMGNREMYMDCAIVDISGSSSSKSFTGPGLYRANTLSDGTCITIEGEDVVFPNPGPSVEYGGKMSKSSAVTKLSPCSYNEDTTVTIGPEGLASSPGSGSSTSAPASSSTKSAASSSTHAAATTAKPTTVAQPTTAAATTKPATTRSTQGASSAMTSTTTRPARVPFRSRYLLSSSSTSTSSAKPTTTAAQKTATTVEQEPTTTAAPPAATSSASSGSGSSNNGGTWLKCLSSTTWALCDAAGCTNMGSVAAGTICKDGGIVMAPMNKKRDEERMVRVVSKEKEKKRRSENAQVEPSAPVAENRKMRRNMFAGPAGRAHVARSRSGH
ncbi:endoglucanase [Rhodotorula toruloides]|uniref:BY PROTMAP: gi/472587353/gb/EMS24852.1/ endoglucanase [Rhodosporidium toruloides NP11] gi/647401282/emb/CDR47410.1/ RHTO0S14e03334g1_1 [Rhodosporidium toruloides] n=1 Tax=Rhodotorula toruloides TaxID=5286 RepID=A0A0K3CAD0_RHOTO|nr:endoglucanase [Rhodotorula toruloides]PRQ77215.1 hypothetical protein AAT19DRAFT_12633 [Rhodotorula toruloides]